MANLMTDNDLTQDICINKA